MASVEVNDTVYCHLLSCLILQKQHPPNHTLTFNTEMKYYLIFSHPWVSWKVLYTFKIRKVNLSESKFALFFIVFIIMFFGIIFHVTQSLS